jgi:hypothetical protein
VVGYAEDHSPHTYNVLKYVPNGPGEIIITTNVRWEHWKSQSSVTQLQHSSVNHPPISGTTIIHQSGRLKPSKTRTYGKNDK